MCTYLFGFRHVLQIVVMLLFIFPTVVLGEVAAISPGGYKVLPLRADNEDDIRWASYLYGQLNRRTGAKDIVIDSENVAGDFLKIKVCLDASQSDDYIIERRNHDIVLRANSNAHMIWVIYQFLALAAEKDDRIMSNDLFPAQIGYNEGGEFCFEYRSIYMSANANEELLPILGAHHVDYDWALWGHNLSKVFKGKIPVTAQATVDGKLQNVQFCFSSEALYNATVAYIVDQYGEGDRNNQLRFSIMPEDNSVVCMCPRCIAAGNTRSSATPAVARLIARLAQRFPHYMFFTSSYATTYEPPHHRLPANTGVWISAMDLPFTPILQNSDQAKRFAARVQSWLSVTDKVYVWDYMRNFDDYLTPFPCLNILKSRLQFYRSLNVKGVFLNGSGDDYATFDDVQTYVLAALLRNPDVEMHSLWSKYFAHFYPVTANLLGEYYSNLEDVVFARKKMLSFYGGIAEALSSYLNAADFHDFFIALDRVSKKTEPEERYRLNKLLTALHFTRLEILRQNVSQIERQKVEEILTLLKGHQVFSDMKNYREANGAIDAYIENWYRMLAVACPQDNLVMGKKLKMFLGRGSVSETPDILTDGYYGFDSDYHTAWMIVDSLQMNIELKMNEMQRVVFSFFYAPGWHIVLPAAIEFWQEGVLLGKAEIPDERFLTPGTHVRIEIKPLTLRSDIPLSLRIKKNNNFGKNTFALDEIELYENN